MGCKEVTLKGAEGGQLDTACSMGAGADMWLVIEQNC